MSPRPDPETEPDLEAQPETPPSDAILVARAQAGDRRAFAALYRRHARMVHAVLLARLPHAEVGDAMQDTFTQGLARLASLRDPSAISPWLASIARNRARDWHKHGQARRELTHEPGQLDETSGRGRDLDDALGLLAAIQRVPESQRELLILRFVEGLSGPEIAAAVGMTHGSVRVGLHRGVASLRQILGREPGPARDDEQEPPR